MIILKMTKAVPKPPNEPPPMDIQDVPYIPFFLEEMEKDKGAFQHKIIQDKENFKDEAVQDKEIVQDEVVQEKEFFQDQVVQEIQTVKDEVVRDKEAVQDEVDAAIKLMEKTMEEISEPLSQSDIIANATINELTEAAKTVADFATTMSNIQENDAFKDMTNTMKEIIDPLLQPDIITNATKEEIMGAAIAGVVTTLATKISVTTSVAVGLAAAYAAVHPGIAGDLARKVGSGAAYTAKVASGIMSKSVGNPASAKLLKLSSETLAQMIENQEEDFLQVIGEAEKAIEIIEETERNMEIDDKSKSAANIIKEAEELINEIEEEKEEEQVAKAKEQAKIEEMKAAAEEQAKIIEINAKVMALGNERDSLKSRIAQLKELVADAKEEKITQSNEQQLSDSNERTTQEIFEKGIPGDTMDFDKMTVTQLKEQLKSRWFKVSGKKEDLIKRLRS